MNKIVETYREQLKTLTTWFPSVIFTEPNSMLPQRKKAEQRCIKVNSEVYSYRIHTMLRDALSEVETNFLLGCNTIILEQLFTSCGRLQGLMEAHQSVMKNTFKREPLMKGWEECGEWVSFETICDQYARIMLSIQWSSEAKGEYVDSTKNEEGYALDEYKKTYYDAVKAGKKEYKELNK
ncbi:hypothetical protein NVP1101O_185 [Vibrio phage 1.101.O._10N.261.45.C6]|nr:hypothetical protein NVP1101O_185 [Vibrio phage 1.101.O._10N.261.45.C6]